MEKNGSNCGSYFDILTKYRVAPGFHATSQSLLLMFTPKSHHIVKKTRRAGQNGQPAQFVYSVLLVTFYRDSNPCRGYSHGSHDGRSLCICRGNHKHNRGCNTAFHMGRNSHLLLREVQCKAPAYKPSQQVERTNHACNHAMVRHLKLKKWQLQELRVPMCLKRF
jgi:hypothetical protein